LHGKAQHREAAADAAFVKRFEARILRRESAFARGVDDQQNLPAIVRERNLPRVFVEAVFALSE
jgi:hypothetical protein